MSTEIVSWTQADSARAMQFWREYQQQHDVSGQVGQAVGIDPETGRIWFGDSARDITRQQLAEDAYRPLYVLRVGQDYYQRKRGYR